MVNDVEDFILDISR